MKGINKDRTYIDEINTKAGLSLLEGLSINNSVSGLILFNNLLYNL